MGDRIIVPRYDPELLQDISWLPLGDVSAFDTVMVDVRWPAAGEAVLRAARAAKVPTVLDADVAAREVLQSLVPLASHCVFSEPAALSFTRASSPTAALLQLARDFPSAFMAVTVGSDGCWWLDASSRELKHLKAPKVDVVDTLSAGDVFHGAFAVGLAEGRSMADTIRRANGAAALKCSRFGGRLGAPTRTELDTFLAQQDNDDGR